MSSCSIIRCSWCGNDPLYQRYHDEEWGVPLHEDPALFELLCLEGAQAGLSWITVLRKRENYRRLFDGFDAEKIVRYTPERIEKILQDPGIIRNRLKVRAVISNARAYLKVKAEFGSFDRYIWQFVDGKPIVNNIPSHQDIPVTTVVSDAMSKDLQKRGFTFVGSTICYAFMQASGMVDDHVNDCWRKML